MSQIASSFIVPEDRLPSIADLLRGGKFDAFWTAIRPFETAVKYEEYSGYVVAVLIAFLNERGINLPLDETNPMVAANANGDVGLIVVANTEQSAAAVTALNNLSVSDDELAVYFEEFSEYSFPEAGRAMRAAIDFIISGMTAQARTGGRYLLFIG